MIFAWSLFAAMSAFAKHSYEHTTPAITFFCQNFIAFLVLLPYFFQNGIGWLRGEQWRLIAARGSLGAAAFFLLFFSLSKIPLTNATLLNNTSPLFVPFLATLLLKIPLRAAVCCSAGIGFLGVVLILKPSAGLFQLGALPALVAGIFSAIVMIIMRLLAKQNPKRVIFGYMVIASTASLPFALPQLSSVPAIAWPSLLCVGIIFGIGQMYYTRAFQYAEPTVLAPFSYSFVVVSGLIDWLVWHHAPTLASITGFLLIAVGGILTILYSRKPSRQKISEISPQ